MSHVFMATAGVASVLSVLAVGLALKIRFHLSGFVGQHVQSDGTSRTVQPG